MAGRIRRWPAGVVVLLLVAVLSQVAAVADDGDGTGVAGPDLSRVSTVIGPDFRVSGPAATANEGSSAVAYNSTSDRYLVVWQDWRNNATRGGDIYGQLLAADGSKIGGDFLISGPAATADEWAPVVAYNSTANQYLVVWQDGRDDGTRGYDMYGRRVKASGKLAGGDFLISGPAATADESSPGVAYNSTNNEYLVVWYDKRDAGTRGYDIYGRRVKATGRLAGGDFLISGPAATSSEWNPVVAYNSTNNQYLVVWYDLRNDPARGWDIYGRRVKAGGRLAGGDFLISGPAATSHDYNPAVVYNSTANQYLVVWQDGRDDGTRGYDIYGRRVKAGGMPAGGDFLISGPAATSNEAAPGVAYNSTGDQYLVVWVDGRDSGTRGQDIYGRRVKAGGKLAGGDFLISGPAATSNEAAPGVAYNSTGNQYLIVWKDSRDSGIRGADIYGRRAAG